MSRCTIEIEFSRTGWVFAFKEYITLTTTNVKSLFEPQLKDLFSYLNDTYTFAYIKDSDFTTGRKVWSFQRIYSLQLQFFLGRHSTTHYHSVIHGIHHIDFIFHKKSLNQEIFSQSGGVIRFSINRIGCVSQFIIRLHYFFRFVCSEGKDTKYF